MLKMLLDPMGGIVITNGARPRPWTRARRARTHKPHPHAHLHTHRPPDGNAILREIDVAHPAAKSMLELARSQDEEVGDGTTSVIIIAGELLVVSEPFLARNLHPTVIVNAFHRALEAALQIVRGRARAHARPRVSTASHDCACSQPPPAPPLPPIPARRARSWRSTLTRRTACRCAT